MAKTGLTSYDAAGVAFRVVRPDELEWITRPHEPDEPARHVAELSERAGFAHTRANIWRYEPGAKGADTGTRSRRRRSSSSPGRCRCTSATRRSVRTCRRAG